MDGAGTAGDGAPPTPVTRRPARVPWRILEILRRIADRTTSDRATFTGTSSSAGHDVDRPGAGREGPDGPQGESSAHASAGAEANSPMERRGRREPVQGGVAGDCGRDGRGDRPRRAAGPAHRPREHSERGDRVLVVAADGYDRWLR